MQWPKEKYLPITSESCSQLPRSQNKSGEKKVSARASDVYEKQIINCRINTLSQCLTNVLSEQTHFSVNLSFGGVCGGCEG